MSRKPEKIKLRKKEKEFAEQNHNLIYTLMHSMNAPIDDYYDVAAYGYIKAVVKYNRNKSLRKYCFSTIARQSIRTYIHNERESRKRYNTHIAYSVDDEDMYGDLIEICDEKDRLKEKEEYDEIMHMLKQLRPVLSDDQYLQTVYLLAGYKKEEIRKKKEDKSARAYETDMDKIKQAVILLMKSRNQKERIRQWEAV